MNHDHSVREVDRAPVRRCLSRIVCTSLAAEKGRQFENGKALQISPTDVLRTSSIVEGQDEREGFSKVIRA
jgi:hypothetical protein